MASDEKSFTVVGRFQALRGSDPFGMQLCDAPMRKAVTTAAALLARVNATSLGAPLTFWQV